MVRILVLLTMAVLSLNAHAQDFQMNVNGPLTKNNSYNGFGCTGQNLPPDVSWSHAPEGTRSFALTVYDPDAPTGSGWWHWVVINIPAHTRNIQDGEIPEAARSIRNDYSKFGWGGPCPPAGDQPHHYVFTVYALDVPSFQLPKNASAALAGFMIHRHTLAKAQETLMYGR